MLIYYCLTIVANVIAAVAFHKSINLTGLSILPLFLIALMIFQAFIFKNEKTENGYSYRFEIPANTTATLTLPLLPDGFYYLLDDKPVEQVTDIICHGVSGNQVSFELSSGSYCFTTSD